MDNYVQKRLIEKEVNVFNTMSKTKLKTATTQKSFTVMISKVKTLLSVNLDRVLFGRLVIVAKSKDLE